MLEWISAGGICTGGIGIVFSLFPLVLKNGSSSSRSPEFWFDPQFSSHLIVSQNLRFLSAAGPIGQTARISRHLPFAQRQTNIGMSFSVISLYQQASSTLWLGCLLVVFDQKPAKSTPTRRRWVPNKLCLFIVSLGSDFDITKSAKSHKTHPPPRKNPTTPLFPLKKN